MIVVYTSSQISSDIGEVLDGLNGLGARKVAHKRPIASLTLSNSEKQNIIVYNRQ